MPGVPFLYYGDEIGLRYQDLPSKEGGYTRTGTRTPMQWGPGPNLGFSAAPADKLYLPVDTAPDAPTVAAQEADPSSLLASVKAILALRHAEPDLRSVPNLEVLLSEPERPFVYRRGSCVMALNPSGSPAEAALPGLAGKPLYTIGSGTLAGGKCSIGAQSFCAWKV